MLYRRVIKIIKYYRQELYGVGQLLFEQVHDNMAYSIFFFQTIHKFTNIPVYKIKPIKTNRSYKYQKRWEIYQIAAEFPDGVLKCYVTKQA